MLSSVCNHALRTSRRAALLTNNNKHLLSCTTQNIVSGVRFYRCESGDMVQNVDEKEHALQEKAKDRYATIMEQHRSLPETDADRKKRLIYRSKQRGWLEVDLLLGTWANENVNDLADDELDMFEELVNEETIDIYNILTLRADIPERLADNVVVQRVQEWAKTSPLGKASAEDYKKVKMEHNLT